MPEIRSSRDPTIIFNVFYYNFAPKYGSFKSTLIATMQTNSFHFITCLFEIILPLHQKCQCTNEPGKCLSDDQFCNGVNDCLDGQDEEECCQGCID